MSDNSSQAFEDDIGIIAALETIFQQQYPLLIHRVEFLTKNQTSESPLNYLSTMRKLAQYADLANLSPDLILASRIMSGMKDGQCKSKRLALTNPTTDDVQKKATDWLVTQKKKKGTQLDKKEEARLVDTQGAQAVFRVQQHEARQGHLHAQIHRALQLMREGRLLPAGMQVQGQVWFGW